MPLVAWSPKDQASRARARATHHQGQGPGQTAPEPRKDQLVDAFFTLRIWLSESFGVRRISRLAGTRGPSPKRSGADRDRTDDLGFAKPALSQLSYSPVQVWELTGA